MIFAGIKRKSNQLFLKNNLPGLLEGFNAEKHDVVQNVLVLCDNIDRAIKIKQLLINDLRLQKDSIDLAVFQKTPMAVEADIIAISPSDFGWYGGIKSGALRKILTNKYDLLINYNKIDNLYTNLVLLQCQSSFRVGFEGSDDRFYDLLINCNKEDAITFGDELKKYLLILKKL